MCPLQENSRSATEWEVTIHGSTSRLPDLSVVEETGFVIGVEEVAILRVILSVQQAVPHARDVMSRVILLHSVRPRAKGRSSEKVNFTTRVDVAKSEYPEDSDDNLSDHYLILKACSGLWHFCTSV